MIPCVGNLLEYFGTSWTCIVTILVIVGMGIVFVYFMCVASGKRSQIEREQEYGDWLRKQLEILGGDHWDGEDKG